MTTPTPDKLEIPEAAVEATVPARFRIPGIAIANLVFQCGSNEDNTEFFDAIAWIGEVSEEDDGTGEKTFGLHAYSTEYPEEGSVTLAQLPHMPDRGYAEVGELPDAVRVPLHSLTADIEYLFGRVAADGSCAPAMANSALDRLRQVEAAIRALAPSAPADNGDLATELRHLARSAEALTNLLNPHLLPEGAAQQLETTVHQIERAYTAISATPSVAGSSEAEVEAVADAINRARYQGFVGGLPEKGVAEEDKTAREYSYRLARAALLASRRVRSSPVDGDAGDGVAARDVLAERERQKTVEGWTAEHDDRHVDGEMAAAAATYAYFNTAAYGDQPPAEKLWPESWDIAWWKPSGVRRDLVKAGALIIAEIERVDRSLHSQRKG